MNDSTTELTVTLQRLADTEAQAPTQADAATTVATAGLRRTAKRQQLGPGENLAHYRIEAELGEGGMGKVYRAHDTALERQVAIKLIHQQLCAGDWDYLKREATAVMRLQHPNIATFFDLGEQQDAAWLVMEFVAGQSLSDQLKSQRILEQAQLLRLADGLLCALGHAHTAGVIHADIKPANIMLSADGGVKLLDFGIARLVHDIGLPDDHQYTRTDSISGSPGFMSAEQLRAQTMDARSDLFAVAAVLFQAASGEPAFPGASAAERINAVLSHQAGAVVRRLPGPLGELLDQAMHPQRDQRPASAAAFLYALRQVLDGQSRPQPPRALLVLAPQASAAASDLDWLGRALCNVLRPMLEQTGRFDLVPEARISEAAGSGASALELGQQLAARWVVHGQLDRQADAVELSICIRDVATAQLIAERQVSTPLEQLFSLQGELAAWVAEQLSISALPATQAPVWSAVELCARGEAAFARGGKDGLSEAGSFFRQALHKQPQSTVALAGLAGVHAMRYTFTSDTADIDQARSLAEQALGIDANAHAARQWLIYALMRLRQPDQAMQQAEIIMQGSSDPHMACYFAACCLAADARYEQALRFYQASLRDNASRSWTWFGAGNCHARLGHIDSALWCLQRAVDAEPSASHFTTAGCGAFLAEFLRQQGQLDQAWQAGKQALQRVEASDFIYRDSFRALALITLGRTALDRGQLETAEAAFHQAEMGIRGRPNALGAGHLLVQAMAGKAAVRGDRHLLEQASNIMQQDNNWNFDWLWACHQDDSQKALNEAQERLGQP